MLPDCQADPKGCARCNARCDAKGEATRNEISSNGAVGAVMTDGTGMTNRWATMKNNAIAKAFDSATISMNITDRSESDQRNSADHTMQTDKPAQCGKPNTSQPNPMSPALSAMRSPPRQRIPGLTLLEMPERRAHSELARSRPAALHEPMTAKDGYERYDPLDLEDLYGISPSPIPRKRMKSVVGVNRGRRRSEDEAPPPFLSLTDVLLSGAAIPHRAKGSQHDNLHDGA